MKIFLFHMFTIFNSIFGFINNINNKKSINNKIFCKEYYEYYNKTKPIQTDNIEFRTWKLFANNVKENINHLFYSSINLCNKDEDCPSNQICCNIKFMNICCNPHTGVGIYDFEYGLVPIPIPIEYN